jgi:biotin operon repressor
VLKLLSLLQDSDPSLAAAIATSREAIWAILSDRTKFASLDGG